MNVYYFPVIDTKPIYITVMYLVGNVLSTTPTSIRTYPENQILAMFFVLSSPSASGTGDFALACIPNF